MEFTLSNALAQAVKDAITNGFELGALGGLLKIGGVIEAEDPAPVGSSTGFGLFGLYALIALLFSAANNAVGSVLSAWFAPLQALLASSSAH